MGRVAPSQYLPSNLKLNTKLAKKIIQEKIAKPLKLNNFKAAAGIIEICNLKMSNAVRSITIEKGLDPSEFTLCAYGGAGPMHACWIAKQLGIPKVVIPIAPGQFSALGILLGQVRHDLVRTISVNESYNAIEKIFYSMKIEAENLIKKEKAKINKLSFEYSVDARYKGQEFTINISLKDYKFTTKNINDFINKFHKTYEQNYSHSSTQERIEIINLRIVAIGNLSKISIPKIKKGKIKPKKNAIIMKTKMYLENKFVNCEVWDRSKLLAGNQIKGPTMIVDYGSTTIVPNNCLCKVSKYGQIIISIDKNK